MSAVLFDHIVSRLEAHCSPLGLECHAFKIGWYNELVQSPFHLAYHSDTLALVVISAPSMFERLFKPFLNTVVDCRLECIDPLDQCMRKTFHDLGDLFENVQVDGLHDFELHPNKRPKVLVQSAGHVAGAARYYQRSDITEGDPWDTDKRIYGVSVHPEYGGWFALRGVLIFRDVLVPDFLQREPIDCVHTNTMKIDLLHRYNTCWKDWTFRDVTDNPIQDKYSEEQKEYFETPPKERLKLIKGYQSTLQL